MFVFEKNAFISEDEQIKVFENNEIKDVPAHLHEFIELIYIKSSSGVHTIDGVDYKVSYGDLLFVNYGQSHSYVVDGFERHINILLIPQFFSEELMDGESIATLFAQSMFSEFAEMDEITSQCVHFSNNERAEIDTIINMMHDEYNQKKSGYKSMLHGCVRILFTKLLRKLNNDNDIDAEEFLSEILSYINENASDKLNLADVASKSFYSPAHFSRLLKKHYGMSFSSYVKNKRMDNAAKKLTDTDDSIEKIMESVGYSDKKLFYKHFKEKYEVSPGEYRKKSR